MKFFIAVSTLILGFVFSSVNAETSYHEISWKALAEVKPISIKNIDKSKQRKIKYLAEFKDTDIFVYFIDLNNDFIEDIFIFHTNKGKCPNSGCRTQFLMSKHEDIYVDVAKHSFEMRNTFILQGITNNVHDLLIKNVSSSSSIYIRKQWNGNEYLNAEYIQIDFTSTF